MKSNTCPPLTAILLSLILVTLIIKNEYGDFKEKLIIEKEIEVDSVLYPMFEEFKRITEENDIYIDYSKIDHIYYVPLYDTYAALYYKHSKTILLSSVHDYPSILGITEDYLLLIMAHEIGHSQFGPNHTIDGLMGGGDNHLYDALKEKTPEQIIVEGFSN